jgi:hypothetical protein
LYDLTVSIVYGYGSVVYGKGTGKYTWDQQTAHYYPVSRDIFENAELLKLCAETDMLTVSRPPVYMRVSTSAPAMWAAPLERIFNNVENVYLIVELPGIWNTPPLIQDLPDLRGKCIEDTRDYYGAFITTIGCMTPMGDISLEPIVWSITQQVALP